MSITPQQLLDFAHGCYAGNDEVSYRNAAARAYYACYHEVLNMLEHNPKLTGGVHIALTDYLESSAASQEGLEKSKLRALSYLLKALKAQRVESDYNLDLDFRSEDASSALKAADRLFEKCSDLKDDKLKAAKP